MMQFEYFEKIHELLHVLENEEKEHMEQVVRLLLDTIQNDHTIYTFGASHAGIMSEELYYRAGGLMLYNPIFSSELMVDTQPISMTSDLERCEGFGRILAENKADFQPGDVVIIHSVSGRNPVAIDLAMAAKEKGVKVVAITNLDYSKAAASRHSSGKHLYELADIVIDNHGVAGDACIEIEGVTQKVAPTSTIASVAVMNAITAKLVEEMSLAGWKDIPVFYSANLDGGDELNSKLFEKFKNRIRYTL